MSIAPELFHTEAREQHHRDLTPEELAWLEQELTIKAKAVQANPNDAEAVIELEDFTEDAAEAARINSELVSELAEPLTEAAEALTLNPKNDLKKTRVLAAIAGSLYGVVGNEGEAVQIAENQIDRFYSSNHTQGDKLGAEVDEKLAKSWKSAIPQINKNTASGFALNQAAQETLNSVEGSRNYREAEKAYRKTYLHEEDMDATGVTPAGNATLEVEQKAPSPNDTEAYEEWKKKLANKIGINTGRLAMRDDANERMATKEEMAKIRADLADAYGEKRAA
jgi:hypothetical protein